MRRLAWAVLAVAIWAGCVEHHVSNEDVVVVDVPQTPAETATVVPIHRLNHTEYRNTIRDLLGSSLELVSDFPADDVSLGYDNISAVLALSPLQFELYEAASEQLAREALLIPVEANTSHFEAENLVGSVGSATDQGWNLWSNGTVGQSVMLEAGEYTVSARVWAKQAGSENAKAALLASGKELKQFDVVGDINTPEVISTTATLAAGSHEIAVAFLNDFYDPENQLDRNLYVDWIEVEGPLGSVGTNPIREKIVFCDPSAPTCRRDIISAFAQRAWRRTLQKVEVDRLEALMNEAFIDQELDTNAQVEAALELGLRGVLLSPHFIFRPELDDDPTSDVPLPLNDFELASRLSYFIWSSMPDDELLTAAAAGKLKDEAGIRAEVDRMLADPKAAALVDNFAGQWLLVRSLDDHVPDYAAFPDYNDSLRDAFKQEMRLFFGEFVAGKVGLNELLSANFTFVNEQLAEHYDIPFSGGAELERVSLENNPHRFGLLTMGSVLTVTSYPARTSPVKRGVFVLEHLLCDGPPPPPPGVEGITPPEIPVSSLREQLEQHRANPSCASCHNLMDPLGFGLEHYDGIGAYRSEDTGGFPIDASSEYKGATPFDGAGEMAALLKADERFQACLVEQLFVYALGRGTRDEDHPSLATIGEGLANANYLMPDLIKLIATSFPFRHRRGTATMPETSP